MKPSKWVYVTGAPRSGTSFVGRILSLPLSVDLIFEPTDPVVGMPGIDRRYIYLRPWSAEQQLYEELLDRIFTYNFTYRSPAPRPGDGWLTRMRKEMIGPRGAIHLWLAKHNPFHDCAVIKDPDGALLTEYLQARHGVRPVICVRHPAAFVASYLQLGMPRDLTELGGQPALIEDYFGGDASVFDVNLEDPVIGAATLWWGLNRVLLDQCCRHPDWIVVVHEELCQAPVETFRSLFERLDLPWSSGVERAIRQRTGAHNKAEARHWQDHYRNSAALFELRRSMLTREDRERIFDITHDVALRIYTKQSFGLTQETREPPLVSSQRNMNKMGVTSKSCGDPRLRGRMKDPGVRSVDEAILPLMTEGALARWRRTKGKRVIQHRGRWWEELKPGFYHAIHWMARQRGHQAERPTALCWGFRATLHDEDATCANGWLPVHVLTDPASYDLDTLPSKLRNKLRKCRRLNQIVEVTAPPLLRDQGYELRCSVTERLGIWKPPSKERYVRDLDDSISNPYLLVLAGLSNGRLGGYLEARAVDGTAYIDHVYLHSDALSTEVGTGLVFEFVQVCRRSGEIHEVVYGLDVPSDRSLTHYKMKMGFPVIKIPVRYWLLAPVGRFIHWWRPEVYYRLTGEGARGRRTGRPVSVPTIGPGR